MAELSIDGVKVAEIDRDLASLIIKLANQHAGSVTEGVLTPRIPSVSKLPLFHSRINLVREMAVVDVAMTIRFTHETKTISRSKPLSPSP